MFWLLLLAHFLGDFPLQPDWMVRRKNNFWILSLHVSVHFFLMFALVGENRNRVWGYLVILSLVHLIQDYLKLLVTKYWPKQTVMFYFSDQILHYLILWGFAVWMQSVDPQVGKAISPTWAIIAIAYLVATYTWYISERVINWANREYLEFVESTKQSRMLARGGFISIFFLVRAWVLPNVAILFSWPYPESMYRRRAILSDLSVSLVIILFLLVSIGLG